MRIDIDVQGVNGAIDTIGKLQSHIETGVQRGLTSTGFLVQRESRKNAPYRDGYLERAIDFNTGKDFVDIFVPVNSYAGKYAKRMHDSEYNLGEKSRAKGSRAGRLYIKRAIDDNRDKIVNEFKAVLRGF